MKKHKSVISILLAIMMIFTFMPTLAFADSAGEFNADHYPGAVKDGKVLVEPTCTSAGIVEVGCTRDGGICTHKEAVSVAALGHDPVDKRFDTAEEFAAALLNAGVFGTNANTAQKAAAEWLAGPGASICFGYAKVCSVCGALMVDADDELYGLTATPHSVPSGTKACAESFTCERCKKEGCTDDTHNKQYSYDNYHKASKLEAVLQDGKYCNTSVKKTVGSGQYQFAYEVEAWEEVTNYVCKECGEVFGRDSVVRTSQTYPDLTITHSDLNHNMVQTTIKEATCTELGEKATVCTDCGYGDGIVSNIPKKQHKYTVVNSVPATIYSAAYTYNTCEGCGAIDYTSFKESGKPLNVAYSLEVFYPVHCDAAGIVKITRTVENNPEVVKYLTYAGGKYKWFGTNEEFTNFNHTDKDYFLGFTENETISANETLRPGEGIEIPDIKPTGHKWAKAAKVADATCTVAEQEAMTCTICGDIKHPTVKVGKPLGHKMTKVTQEPTCGGRGFTYEVCSVCGYFTEPVYFGAPKVAYGTKCKFDKWIEEKAATPFEEGTKKLVCSVCDDDGHLLVENGMVKEVGVTRSAIAKTKIPAPTVKGLKKKAKVSFKAVEGATKYQILVNGKVVKKNAKAGKTYTIKKKNLKLGKKNTFKIVAYNAAGAKATSAAKSVKIKKK